MVVFGIADSNCIVMREFELFESGAKAGHFVSAGR
jgi:hypothetical protein